MVIILDCLSDVKPIGVRITVDAVNEMWMGERIAEIMGYTNPDHEWDTDSMLDYFEKLVECHDAFVNNNGFVSATPDAIKPLSRKDFTNPLSWWKAIREAVIAHSQQHPTLNPVDVIIKLGITQQEFFTAVTVNKVKYDLTETELRELCDKVGARNPNLSAIGRQYKITRATMNYFRRLGNAVRTARTDAGHQPDRLETT
jgi:hypothetical protein